MKRVGVSTVWLFAATLYVYLGAISIFEGHPAWALIAAPAGIVCLVYSMTWYDRERVDRA